MTTAAVVWPAGPTSSGAGLPPRCDTCDRPLRTPASQRAGRGPVCARRRRPVQLQFALAALGRPRSTVRPGPADIPLPDPDPTAGVTPPANPTPAATTPPAAAGERTPDPVDARARRRPARRRGASVCGPFTADPDVPPDHRGRRVCARCHRPGGPGDPRHPTTTPPPPALPPALAAAARARDAAVLGEREETDAP